MSAVGARCSCGCWLGCCCLLRSLQHGGLHRTRWQACSDTFSQMESTRALSSASLLMCSAVCARVANTATRATAAGKEHPRAFNLYQISIFPYTVCIPRPPALVCILMHALFRFCTCSQPTNPCAPRRDVCNGCRWRRRWTSNCSRSTIPRCSRSRRVIVTWILRVAVVLGAGGAAEGSGFVGPETCWFTTLGLV